MLANAEIHMTNLDHVMEDGHDLRRFILHGVHDPERVEDVRLAVLVLLPLVGSGGDLQRFLDGRHDFPRYETRSDRETPTVRCGTPPGRSCTGRGCCSG